MRIVSRAELKAMPVGTLYAELGDTQRHGWPAARNGAVAERMYEKHETEWRPEA